MGVGQAACALRFRVPDRGESCLAATRKAAAATAARRAREIFQQKNIRESKALGIRTLKFYNLSISGEWPSGKALGSGPRIGGSNPSSPAKQCTKGDHSANLYLQNTAILD